MDYNLWQQLILGATKPFRTGANILAQNWGSALTGKDMSQSENQGGFLRWLAGGITPEEQQVINDKPYLSALKSGAGMASTLAPFASQGLRTAQLAANPLANRIAQLTSQGALEGSLGGFGLSREGKEVQDTLTGGLAGAGGELFMDYLTNPQFRNMLTDATTTISPRTGARMYKGELGSNEDVLDTLNPTGGLTADYTPDTRVKARLGENITTLDKTMGRSADEMITVYRGASNSQGKISPGDFITTNEQLARDYAGTGRVIKERVRLGDILDDLTEPLGEEYIYRPMTGISTIDPLDTLKQEARKYKSVDEFVKAQGTPVYHGGSGVKELSREFRIATPEEKLKFASSGGGYEGLSFSTDRGIAKNYSRNIGNTDEVFEGFINPNAKVKRMDLKGGTPDDLDLEALRRQGYDAIQDIGDKAEREFRALTERAIITKSQLEDIWKQARGLLSK